VLPFITSEAVKVALAAVVFPAVWKLTKI
jgi:biotin transporter BioY